MDGNLRPTTIPSDQIEASLDTSGIITGTTNSTDLVVVFEEEIASPSSDNQMDESLSTEWTDAKHRLYLSSMEASFVKRLFSHEYRSMNKLDWSSRGRSKPDPNSLRQLNASEQPSSGQYKVLGDGHWKQLNFDRPQPWLDVVDESPALPENHCIQRYRPGRRHREVTSPKTEENGSPCDQAVHLGGNNKTATTTLVATSSKRFSNCHSHLYHQESVGSSTEVSDQNFPIEDHKGEQLSSFSRAKRMKTTSVDDSTGVDDSNKDQVVPTGESPVMAVPPI